MQSAAALMNLPPLLDEFGVGLGAVLDGTGLARDDIQPGRFIPYAAFLEVIDRAAVLTGCDHLGLLLGFRHRLADMGPVGAVMRSAATLGEALADFAAFQISNSTGAAVFLNRAGDEVVWGYGVYDKAHAASPHIHDAVLATASVLLSELTKDAVRPEEFSSIRPPPANPAAWRRLGAPIRFGQARTGVVLSRAALAYPLATANRDARDKALSDVASRLSLTRWGWTERTRHAIRPLMLSGRSKMPHVARHLGIHPRSLRRAISREGSSFEAIKDDVRHAVARELLTLTSLPIGDIAETLEFASPSAFNRAFRRWSGSSPTAWRDWQRGRASTMKTIQNLDADGVDGSPK